MDQKLQDWLEQRNISYILHTHQAVFTVEEAQKYCNFIPGLHCKNLFLKEKRGEKRYFLVTLPAEKKIPLKILEELLNCEKLTFANEVELNQYLGLSTGAVSALGLVNDTNNKVIYVIDKEVWDADIVSFHPNINTETVELKKDAFHLTIDLTGNEKIII